MAYGNWGAFVNCNGQRRKDKEDAYLFDGSNSIAHGVLGDGKIRVELRKNFIPCIYTRENKEKKVIEFEDCFIIKNIKNKVDEYKHNFDIEVEYKGYKFIFYNNGDNTIAEMIDNEGNKWKGESGFEFGAGYENFETNIKNIEKFNS